MTRSAFNFTLPSDARVIERSTAGLGDAIAGSMIRSQAAQRQGYLDSLSAQRLAMQEQRMRHTMGIQDEANSRARENFEFQRQERARQTQERAAAAARNEAARDALKRRMIAEGVKGGSIPSYYQAPLKDPIVDQQAQDDLGSLVGAFVSDDSMKDPSKSAKALALIDSIERSPSGAGTFNQQQRYGIEQVGGLNPNTGVDMNDRNELARRKAITDAILKTVGGEKGTTSPDQFAEQYDQLNAPQQALSPEDVAAGNALESQLQNLLAGDGSAMGDLGDIVSGAMAGGADTEVPFAMDSYDAPFEAGAVAPEQMGVMPATLAETQQGGENKPTLLVGSEQQIKSIYDALPKGAPMIYQGRLIYKGEGDM